MFKLIRALWWVAQPLETKPAPAPNAESPGERARFMDLGKAARLLVERDLPLEATIAEFRKLATSMQLTVDDSHIETVKCWHWRRGCEQEIKRHELIKQQFAAQMALRAKLAARKS